MNVKFAFSTLVCSSLLAGAAFAQGVPAPAPDTMITMGSDLFTNGASSNFQPALSQFLDYYYNPGDCRATDDPMTAVDETNYATCDDLRLGLSMHAGKDCNDDLTDPDGPLALYYMPDEDGGVDVKGEMMSIHGARGTYFCDDDNFVNQDTALGRLWEITFPGATSGMPISDSLLDDYWERPHLNLLVTKALPSIDATPADNVDDDRVKKSLAQACKMYQGISVNTLGDEVPAILPSMPTWVVSERRTNTDEALYGSLLAAAGGTAECEHKQGATWSPIDVCTHINEAGVTETKIRQDIDRGNYRCGKGTDVGTICTNPAGKAEGVACAIDSECQGYCDAGVCAGECTTYSTGGGAAEVLSDIRCLLSTRCAGNREKTDLLGLFACVRQVPRGIVVEDNMVVRFCQNGSAPDYTNPLLPECGNEMPAGSPCCNVLTEANGDIEFIDENRTLFVITDRNNCDGVNVDVFECPLNEPCDTGGVGRCASGHVECPGNYPTCVPNFEHYPEICNGLDDDCDGKVDNISASWNKTLYDNYSLEDGHEGLACDELDVCVCPGGATDTHAGGTWSAFQDAWDPVCECGEGLAPSDDGPQSVGEPAPISGDTQASCSAVAGGAVPGSFVALLFAYLIGRRRR